MTFLNESPMFQAIPHVLRYSNVAGQSPRSIVLTTWDYYYYYYYYYLAAESANGRVGAR